MAPEIGLRDAPENASEASFHVCFFLAIAAGHQNIANLAGRQGSHLFGADHQGNASATGLDEIECAKKRG